MQVNTGTPRSMPQNPQNPPNTGSSFAGSQEKYEEAKRKAGLAKTEAGEEAIEEAEEAAEDVSKRKFVIDRLSIKGVKVKYGKLTIPIPVDIVLTDLGKESDGLTLTELCQEVWKSILKAASAIGDGVKAIGNIIGEGAGQLGEGAKKTSEAVKSLLNF